MRAFHNLVAVLQLLPSFAVSQQLRAAQTTNHFSAWPAQSDSVQQVILPEQTNRSITGQSYAKSFSTRDSYVSVLYSAHPRDALVVCEVALPNNRAAMLRALLDYLNDFKLFAAARTVTVDSREPPNWAASKSLVLTLTSLESLVTRIEKVIEIVLRKYNMSFTNGLYCSKYAYTTTTYYEGVYGMTSGAAEWDLIDSKLNAALLEGAQILDEVEENEAERNDTERCGA